jgi:hypothetical protein
LDCGFSAPAWPQSCSDCFCLIMNGKLSSPCRAEAPGLGVAALRGHISYEARGGRPRRLQNGNDNDQHSLPVLLLAALTPCSLRSAGSIGGRARHRLIAFLIAGGDETSWLLAQADRMVLAMYRAQPVDRATAATALRDRGGIGASAQIFRCRAVLCDRNSEQPNVLRHCPQSAACLLSPRPEAFLRLCSPMRSLTAGPSPIELAHVAQPRHIDHGRSPATNRRGDFGMLANFAYFLQAAVIPRQQPLGAYRLC